MVQSENAGHDDELPDDEVVVLLIRTAKAIVDRLRAEHPEGASSPMTVVHGLAARYLVGRNDVTAVELSRYLGITKQSTSEVVALLESTGIIRRAPHPTDGRARVLLLTGAGAAKLALGQCRWTDIEAEWTDLVGAERMTSMRAALEAFLAADITARDETPSPETPSPETPSPETTSSETMSS